MSDRSNTGDIIVSFMAGALVGAGVALLFAPQSGEETRRKIRETAEEWKDKGEDWARKTKEKFAGSNA